MNRKYGIIGVIFAIEKSVELQILYVSLQKFEAFDNFLGFVLVFKLFGNIDYILGVRKSCLEGLVLCDLVLTGFLGLEDFLSFFWLVPEAILCHCLLVVRDSKLKIRDVKDTP